MNQPDEARASVDLNHYSYRVVWPPEDGEYVATALEWGPGLSWLDEDPTAALAEENVSLNSLAVRLLAEKEAQHARPSLDKAPA